MGEPKDHALYAASSSERWLNCASSLKQIADAPFKKSGAAAGEGELAHELMEFALNAGVKNVVKFYERDTKYPLQMKKDIQGLVSFVNEQRSKHKDTTLLVETKTYLDYVHPTEAFGTLDIGILAPKAGRIYVDDLKYGRIYVSEKDNTQLRYYGVGLAYECNWDFKEFIGTIYQPRAGGQIDRSVTITKKELKAFEQELVEGVDRCESATKTSDLQAGKWCKFCPAKISCPEVRNAGLREAQLVFGSAVQPDPKHLTSNQLKAFLDKAAYLKMWVKEVESYAEERLNEGHKINGWGLTPKRASRVWNNANNFKIGKTSSLKSYQKVKSYGLSFLTTEAKSVSEVEKEMKEAGVPKELIQEFISANSSSVSSGTKLAQTNNDYDVDLLLIEDVD